jgi:lysophospholipase L1-like esterase
MKQITMKLVILGIVALAGVLFIGCGKKGAMKPEKLLTIVFFGDSVIYGYGLADQSESFVGRIESIVEAGVYDDINIVNAGVVGDDTNEAFGRLTEVKEYRPDIIVFAFGLNDCQNARIDTLRFRQNLLRMIAALRPETKIVLATSNSFMETGQDIWKRLNDSLDEYMDVVRAISRERDYPLIDVHYEWNDLLRRDTFALESMYIDPTHPSAKGHKLIFETYMNVLRKMFVR